MSRCGQLIGADCAPGYHREIHCDREGTVDDGSGELICPECTVVAVESGYFQAPLSGAQLEDVIAAAKAEAYAEGYKHGMAFKAAQEVHDA